MRIAFTLLALVLSGGLVVTAQQKSSEAAGGVTGTLKRHANFPSKHVLARNVDVWLPPGYEKADNGKRFPVIYMQDGQNLFDPKTSYIGVDWGIDETMTRLIAEKRIRDAIVVGIWNTPKRILEYMPQKVKIRNGDASIKNLPMPLQVPLESDNYLRFVVTELKPFIDSTYRTLPDMKNTFIMGSSMGGLISAYAISEYPKVFGGAGCMSTHWPAGDGAVIDYLKKSLPDPNTHKFYFDFGTETLDAQYEPYQLRADAVMKQAGYVEGRNWITKKFVGDDHSERSWSKRVDVPLQFFLGN